MKTARIIALLLCALWLCTSSSLMADAPPAYAGTTLISQNTANGATTSTFSLPKDTKRADVLAFYEAQRKLSEWSADSSIDSPWLCLRSYTKDGRAFGIALYDGKLLVMDGTEALGSTIGNWVREAVEFAAPPIATVGADTISYRQYHDRLERLPSESGVAASGGTTEMGLSLLDNLIKERLALKLAEKVGVTPTDQQVEDRMKKTLAQTGVGAEILNQQGITSAEFKENMRIMQAFYNLQTRGITVTPADILKYYNDHKKEFTIPDQVVPAGIFVNTKKDADKAMGLLKAGVEFRTVARTMSKHESAKADGKLEVIVRGDGKLPESVQAILFKTAVGKYTQPIPSGGSTYVIFQVLAHAPPRVIPLAQLKDQIHDQLLMEKGTKKNDVNKALDELRKSMDVKINMERYKSPISR